MLLEILIENVGLHPQVRNAISDLHHAGVFGSLMELSNKRGHLPHNDVDITSAALSAAWRDGYNDALSDLFYIFDRIILPATKKNIQPDFGALSTLLSNKEISQEEYDRLRSRPSID